MAVDDNYIRNNPSDRVLKELKQSCFAKSEKRMALTRAEQDLFLDFLNVQFSWVKNRVWFSHAILQANIIYKYK